MKPLTLSDVRSHDELRPERDGNGQEMVKCDIRVVFHKVRFRKMSQTDPVFNANRAPGMHLLQNPGPDLSVTDQTDDGRTTKLERSLHNSLNRPFGQ